MTRRWAVPLFVVALVAAAALVVASGAVVLDGPTDRIDEDVALQPAPDSPYAFIEENGHADDDGDLVIDLTADNPAVEGDGVNPTALTGVDELFYVIYDGDAVADVWLSHDAEAVSFVVDGDPIDDAEDPIRLTPDDDVATVALEVDTRVVEVDPGTAVIDGIGVNARIVAESEESEESENGDGSGTSSTDPSASVSAPEPDRRTVEVRSLPGDARTDVTLDDLRLGTDGVVMPRLEVVRDGPGDLAFAIESDTEPLPPSEDDGDGNADPEDATEPVDAPGIESLAYYRITPETAPGFAERDPDEPLPVSEATFVVDVDRDRLAAAGVDPDDDAGDDLAGYRLVDGDWTELEAERADTVEGVDASPDPKVVRFVVRSPGFSAFAVAVHRPAIEPTEATILPADSGDDGPISVDDAETVVGEETTVEAGVTNVGPVEGGESVTLLANGSPIETLDTAVEPDDEAVLSGTVSFDEPGEYDLVVEGDAVVSGSIATLTVVDPDDAASGSGGAVGPAAAELPAIDVPELDPGPTGPTDSPPTQEAGGFGFAELVGLLGFIAIVLTTVLLVKRMPSG